MRGTAEQYPVDLNSRTVHCTVPSELLNLAAKFELSNLLIPNVCVNETLSVLMSVETMDGFASHAGRTR